MLQVLFRIPMTVAGVPLWVVLLALGVGLGLLMWWISRRVANPALAEILSPVGKGAMVVGVMAAAGAYYFRDSFPKAGVPIYGFGMMLFLAFLVCTWLGGRRGEYEGIKNETMQDLAIWIFGGGLLGARVCYLLLNEDPRPTLSEFFAKLPRIWDGGIILYGSVVGAIATYAIAYWLIFRHKGIQTRRLADAVAPSIAVGLCLGRLGCFLNGCCFGGVTCEACPVPVPAVGFPMSAPPRDALVRSGRQTSAGFTLASQASATVARVNPGSPADKAGLPPGAMITGVNGRLIHVGDDIVAAFMAAKGEGDTLEVKLSFHPPAEEGERTETIRIPASPPASRLSAAGIYLRSNLSTVVEQVDPHSAAYKAGLGQGDFILSVNGNAVQSGAAIDRYLGSLDGWERGESLVTLEVQPRKGGETKELSFRPKTLPLYATQVYEVVSMALLCLVLFAYEGFRRNPGQVAAVLMVGYGVHRFLNEILRADDRPIGFERYGSLLLVVGGVILWAWLQWRKDVDAPVEPVGEAAKKLGTLTPDAPPDVIKGASAVMPGP